MPGSAVPGPGGFITRLPGPPLAPGDTFLTSTISASSAGLKVPRAELTALAGVRDRKRRRRQVLDIGDLSLPAIAMESTGAIEIAVHGWDISQASGQNRPIPDALATTLLPIAPLLIPETGRHLLFSPPVTADGRALRIETVVNSPDDLGCQRRLHNLPELQARARAVSARLLHTERVGQGCVFDSPAFARISQPTLTQDGRRAPGLRFGDPRVMALAGALANTLCAVTGITNKSLRALMTGLPGTAYTMNQASYDLARLTRNGLVTRVPHRNLYALTTDGLRFAIFYTKVHDRVLRPLMAGDQPQAPPALRQALRVIDQEVSRRLAAARLPALA
jgi:hypothetical protein